MQVEPVNFELKKVQLPIKKFVQIEPVNFEFKKVQLNKKNE